MTCSQNAFSWWAFLPSSLCLQAASPSLVVLIVLFALALFIKFFVKVSRPVLYGLLNKNMFPGNTAWFQPDVFVLAASCSAFRWIHVERHFVVLIWHIIEVDVKITKKRECKYLHLIVVLPVDAGVPSIKFCLKRKGAAPLHKAFWAKCCRSAFFKSTKRSAHLKCAFQVFFDFWWIGTFLHAALWHNYPTNAHFEGWRPWIETQLMFTQDSNAAKRCCHDYVVTVGGGLHWHSHYFSVEDLIHQPTALLPTNHQPTSSCISSVPSPHDAGFCVFSSSKATSPDGQARAPVQQLTAPFGTDNSASWERETDRALKVNDGARERHCVTTTTTSPSIHFCRRQLWFLLILFYFMAWLWRPTAVFNQLLINGQYFFAGCFHCMANFMVGFVFIVWSPIAACRSLFH